MSRASVVVIVAPVRGAESLHFCGTPLQGADDWYPLEGLSVFAAIEKRMIEGGIAHNVTSVQAIRNCGQSTDFRVVYNEAA